MTTVNYNERSWAIDLISDINAWLKNRDIIIKRGGGEYTLQAGKESLFPDVLLFGDNQKGLVLQGWELKMPDTPLTDTEYINNAKAKAKLLSLNSFLLWNVSTAVLYCIEEDDSLSILKTWNNLSHISNRNEVLAHRNEILVMLDEILTDINSYITSGTVKKTTITNVVNGGIISKVIQSHSLAYAEVLESFASKHSDFYNEITLWWRYVKNDYPEEDNKYIVAARSCLLSIINKFIFANILKSYHKGANAIDLITPATEVKEALGIFNGLTIQCDFWNIFKPQLGEDFIPPLAWKDIVNLQSLFREFNFANIDKTLIHDMLSIIISANKRKYAGQYATPPELAKLIAEITIKNFSFPAFDPCCGTGTIVSQIYRLKKSNIGSEQALSTLWASDKFSLPLQMAAINVAEPSAIGFPMKIFRADATKLKSGEDIIFHKPFSGEAFTEKIPKFGYIISNLPFVQQEDIEELNPDVFTINSFISSHLGTNSQLDSRSDLHAYMPFYFWNLLATGGELSIIVSNSWLGTAWGQSYFNTLSRFYQIKSIFTSGHGRWFENAKVVTNIITMVKRDTPSAPAGDEDIHFVVTNKSLSSYDATAIGEIKALLATDHSLDEDDISINTCRIEDVYKVLDVGPNLNCFFADNKWLIEIESKLTKISDLFYVSRGERRGWDKLFYPEEPNNIEAEYLQPVLKTPRSLSGLLASPDGVAFCCTRSISDLENLGHRGALNWIRRFEGLTNSKGIRLTKSLARPNTNWYTMLPSTKGIIVTNINFGDRLFFSRFLKPTFVNQRLVAFEPKNSDIDTRLCHALMNSLMGIYYIEAMGTGRGEGALDLSKDKFENSFHILNPALISEEDKSNILAHFEKLELRKVLPIFEELGQEDRNRFDNAVLDAFNLIGYKEKIVKSLITLYKIRNAVRVS